MDLARSRDHVSHGSHVSWPSTDRSKRRAGNEDRYRSSRAGEALVRHTASLSQYEMITSRSPPYRLPTAPPGPAAGTNLVRTGIRTASAYRSEAQQRERIIWPEHHWLSADNLVGRTLLVAAAPSQWTQLVFAARVLLLTLVILFDCPLSRDSHPYGEVSTHRVRVTTLHTTMEDS